MTNIYNKFVHPPNGTLIGNWYEEQCLRYETNEGRAVKPHHIPKKFMDFDNHYTSTTAVDDTFQRTIGNRPYNSFSTEYQTYGDFARFEIQKKKLPLREKMYNDFINNYKGVKEELPVAKEKVNINELNRENERKRLEEKIKIGAEGFAKKVYAFCEEHGWMALKNMKEYLKQCSKKHDNFVPAYDFKILILNYGIYFDDNEMFYVIEGYKNDKKDLDYEVLLDTLVICTEDRFKKIQALCQIIQGNSENKNVVNKSSAAKLFEFKKHPEYLSGKKNGNEIKKDFDDIFNGKDEITVGEFIKSLVEVSICISDDSDFDNILKCLGYHE